MRDMQRQPQLPLKTAKGSLLARPMVVILVVNVAKALAHALLDTAVLLPDGVATPRPIAMPPIVRSTMVPAVTHSRSPVELIQPTSQGHSSALWRMVAWASMTVLPRVILP